MPFSSKTAILGHFWGFKNSKQGICTYNPKMYCTYILFFFTDNGHNLFLDPIQKFRLIHLHQEGLKIPDQCLDTIY